MILKVCAGLAVGGGYESSSTPISGTPTSAISVLGCGRSCLYCVLRVVVRIIMLLHMQSWAFGCCGIEWLTLFGLCYGTFALFGCILRGAII